MQDSDVSPVCVQVWFRLVKDAAVVLNRDQDLSSESEHDHKHFHTAGLSTSGCFTATSDMLMENKQPGTLSVKISVIHSVSAFLQLNYVN